MKIDSYILALYDECQDQVVVGLDGIISRLFRLTELGTASVVVGLEHCWDVFFYAVQSWSMN